MVLGFAFTRTLARDCLPHCSFVFLQPSVRLRPFRAATLR